MNEMQSSLNLSNVQIPNFLSKHNLKNELECGDFFEGCADALEGLPRKATQSQSYHKGYDFEDKQGATK